MVTSLFQLIAPGLCQSSQAPGQCRGPGGLVPSHLGFGKKKKKKEWSGLEGLPGAHHEAGCLDNVALAYLLGSLGAHLWDGVGSALALASLLEPASCPCIVMSGELVLLRLGGWVWAPAGH